MRYAVLIFLSLLIQNAIAADYGDQRTTDRLDNIEKNLNILQKQFYSKDTSNYVKSRGDGKGSPKLEVRVTSLEEQNRYLTGKIEEKDFIINNLSNKIDSLINDMNLRFAEIEKPRENKVDISENKNQDLILAPQALENNLGTQSESLDAANDYDKAFEYMRQANYEKAEMYFKQFITNNKNSELIGNAYFWIGQMYFLQNKYEESAVNFLKGYQQNPKGNKASYNLMKLGMSLSKLNKKQEACTTYTKVLKEFPDADSNIKDQIKVEQTSLTCS